MVNNYDVEKLIKHIKYPPLEIEYGVNRAQGYGFDFDSYIKIGIIINFYDSG